MYLVDTSVIIDFLRERDNQAVNFFISLLEQDMPFGITSIIYQEVLQGAKSIQDFNKLRDFLGSLIFYFPKDSVLSYAAAANIYFDCRKKGVTIRSTIDCLIVQIAIEHNLQLLHNDNDFIQIANVVPALKIVGMT
ncbi:MAG: PIN domain nuclease [Legionellales bacterium]|nr:PIN domain nuclease [Legionellales bacterium]